MTQRMSTLLILAVFLALVIVAGIGAQSAGLGTAGVATIESSGRSFTGTRMQDGTKSATVAVVPITGVIASGDSSPAGDVTGAEDAVAMLEAVRVSKSYDGVILEINSPGGGVLASAEIAAEVQRLRNADIKVVAWMRETAASGGYYVASGADRIVASTETITGSIGVILSLFDVTKLASKVGVQEVHVTSGPLKDMGSPFRTLSPEARTVLQQLVDESYTGFVQQVAAGRDIPEADVRKLADGRIYTGTQAKELDLVDAIGLRSKAYDEMARLIGADDGSDLRVTRFSRSFGLLDLLNSSMGDLVPRDIAGVLQRAKQPLVESSGRATASSGGFELEYRMAVR